MFLKTTDLLLIRVNTALKEKNYVRHSYFPGQSLVGTDTRTGAESAPRGEPPPPHFCEPSSMAESQAAQCISGEGSFCFCFHLFPVDMDLPKLCLHCHTSSSFSRFPSLDCQSLPFKVLTHCFSEGRARRGGPGTKDSTRTQYTVSGSSQLSTSVWLVTHWDHVQV